MNLFTQQTGRLLSFIVALLLSLPPAGTSVRAATPGSVVINEIAWMGTPASTNDEWMELYNTTDQDISLTGWTLVAADGTPSITLSGSIPAKGFFLLERTDDSTISDILADKVYSGALANTGEALFLKDPSGNVIDSANANGGSWPAGNSSTKSSMERIDPLTPDSDANWATNDGIIRNGLDAGRNPINGTPKAPNSTTIVKINAPPIANAGHDLITEEGTSITLDGSESYDPDGDALICSWNPGDGSGTLAGCAVSHAYGDNGIFTVALSVDDRRGGISSDTAQITVNNVPPTVNAGSDLTASLSELVHFSGSFTDPGAADTHTIQWDFGDGSTASGTLNQTHSYSAAGVYTVTLTIIDDDGGVGIATLTVTVSEAIVSGDANGDGIIDIRDAMLCAEIALDLRSRSPRTEIACDITAPVGVVDGRDVVRIAEMGLR